MMIDYLKSLFKGTSGNDLLQALENDAYIVDVRSKSEFSSGSVAGAVNIPLDTLTVHIQKFKDKKHIVVCCRSGARSGQAKSILEQKGIKNVVNGGAWQNVQKALSAKK